jgi:hypothetical protein
MIEKFMGGNCQACGQPRFHHGARNLPGGDPLGCKGVPPKKESERVVPGQRVSLLKPAI